VLGDIPVAYGSPICSGGLFTLTPRVQRFRVRAAHPFHDRSGSESACIAGGLEAAFAQLALRNELIARGSEILSECFSMSETSTSYCTLLVTWRHFVTGR